MAKKKVRRVKKRKQNRTEVDTNTAVALDTTKTTQTAASARSKTKSNQSKQQASAEDFRQEYAYVLKDLRLVFILAGFMFILLIAINLVLQ
jgi:folate-dependent phosphoribosylglycinamide formyltransferase PurN